MEMAAAAARILVRGCSKTTAAAAAAAGSSRKEAFFAAPAAFRDHSDPDPEHARATMGRGPIGVGLDPVGPRTRIAFIVYLSTSDS